MDEDTILNEYQVFCLTNVSPLLKEPYVQYVAEGPLGNENNCTRKQQSLRGLAKKLVDSHLKYLEHHKTVKENENLNEWEVFDFNVSFKRPYDVRLKGSRPYTATDLSVAEQKDFFEALMERQREQYDSDADHADIP